MIKTKADLFYYIEQDMMQNKVKSGGGEKLV